MTDNELFGISEQLESSHEKDHFVDSNNMVGDLISRSAVLDEIHKYMEERDYTVGTLYDNICEMSSARPTLYGYNIEHLELIARVLQKEDLPPERVVEALKDIGRIVAIVKDEFEETLRKAVEQCTI